MDNNLFEQLINSPESDILDFKREFYNLNDPDKEGSFLKDIISFSNTIRTETSYIIFGIEETENEGNKLVGISEKIDDAKLQQKVEFKIRPVPKFSYYEFEYKLIGKKFGIIEIPVFKQEVPYQPTQKIKGMELESIYFRRGTSNSIAKPNELVQIFNWFKDNTLEYDFGSMQEEYLANILNNQEYLRHKQKYIELFGNVTILESDILGVHKDALSLFENFKSIEAKPNIRQGKLLSVFDFVKENPKCVIIGGPGVGKTTTLNTLMFKQASVNADRINQNQVPILIQSKEISSKNSFTEIINDTINAKWIKNALVNGDIMFLFDGLNEIPYECQRDTRIEIRKTIANYPKNSYIFSERKFGFENVFNLPVFEIKEFEEPQIVELITKYANGYADSLLKQLKARPKLLSLAKTPFLLTMIILIAKNGGYKIPENKGLLFEQFIETLLLWENKKRSGIKIPVKKDVLSYASYHYNENGVRSVPAAKFKQLLEEALNRIKEKITINEMYEELLFNYFINKSDSDDLSFFHETYQEYFTSLELKNYFEKYNEFPIDIIGEEWLEPFSLCHDLVTSQATQKSLNAIITDNINSHVDAIDTYSSLIPFIERFAINNTEVFQRISYNIRRIPFDYLTDELKSKLNIPIKPSKSYLCRILQVIRYENEPTKITAEDIETLEKFEFNLISTYYRNDINANYVFNYQIEPNNEIVIKPTLKTVAIDFATQQNTLIRFFNFYQVKLSPLPQTVISEENYNLLYNEFDEWYKTHEQSKYIIRRYSIELIKSCIENNLENCKKLVGKGADLNYSNVRGLTPLMVSVKKKHYRIVEYLLSQENIKINQCSADGRGMTAFMYAAQNGDSRILKQFLAKRINVNEGSNGLNKGNRALLIASWEGNLEIVELLLSNGADINQTDSHGFTALIKACIRDRYEVAKYLLQKGADPNQRDKKGNIATDHCKKQDLKILIKSFQK